jgi:hypothetical protein
VAQNQRRAQEPRPRPLPVDGQADPGQRPGFPFGQRPGGAAPAGDRTFPFSMTVKELRDDEDLKTRLAERFANIEYYVPDSLEFDVPNRSIQVKLNRPPQPLVFRSFLEEIQAEGMTLDRSRSSGNQDERIGKFTSGPTVFYRYEELPAAPEESIALLSAALAELDYVDSEQISILPASKQIAVRVKAVTDLPKRQEILERIAAAGIEVK